MPGRSKNTLIMLGILILLAGVALLMEGPWTPINRREKESNVIYAGGSKEEVTRIEISGSKGNIFLSRDNFGWKVGEESKIYPADIGIVDRVLDQLSDLNSGTVVSKNPSKHSSFMLDDEKGIKVTIHSGNERTAEFLVGEQGPDFFSNYIRQQGQPEVLLIQGYIKPLFDRPLKKWRDFTVFSFEAEDAVEAWLTQPEGQLVLKKEEGKWRVTSPVEAEAEPEAIDDLITRIDAIKAVDAVEEKTFASEFDKPTLELRVGFADGTSKGMTIGSFIEEKSQYFVKAENKETVFLLSAYFVEDLKRVINEISSKG